MRKWEDGKLVVEWFNRVIENDNDRFIVDREEIFDLYLDDVLELLQLDYDEYAGLCDAYHLQEKDYPLLQSHLHHVFDPEEYDYYIIMKAR